MSPAEVGAASTPEELQRRYARAMGAGHTDLWELAALRSSFLRRRKELGVGAQEEAEAPPSARRLPQPSRPPRRDEKAGAGASSSNYLWLLLLLAYLCFKVVVRLTKD